MKVNWYIKESAYEEYRTHQREMDDTCNEYDIGSVRVGNLCFDIICHGNHLWFDLYVGGVDTGYGYSHREDYMNYPYDYADSCSFCWDKDLTHVPLETFKTELSAYIEKHINQIGSYVTDFKAIEVNLVDKANESLQLW